MNLQLGGLTGRSMFVSELVTKLSRPTPFFARHANKFLFSCWRGFDSSLYAHGPGEHIALRDAVVETAWRPLNIQEEVCIRFYRRIVLLHGHRLSLLQFQA